MRCLIFYDELYNNCLATIPETGIAITLSDEDAKYWESRVNDMAGDLKAVSLKPGSVPGLIKWFGEQRQENDR